MYPSSSWSEPSSTDGNAGYVSFYGDKGALSLGEFGDYKIYDAGWDVGAHQFVAEPVETRPTPP